MTLKELNYYRQVFHIAQKHFQHSTLPHQSADPASSQRNHSNASQVRNRSELHRNNIAMLLLLISNRDKVHCRSQVKQDHNNMKIKLHKKRRKNKTSTQQSAHDMSKLDDFHLNSFASTHSS